MMSNRKLIYCLCLFGFILFGCAPSKPAVPTAVPTITPIPGWHSLESAGFQIWLPASFLGSSNSNMNIVMPQLLQKGLSYGKIPQSLGQRGTPFTVFAVDVDSKPEAITYMVVEEEKLKQPVDISGYLDLLSSNLTAQSSLFQILQKQVLTSDRYPIGRILVELNTLESGDIKQVVYAEQNGGAMWQISFTTPVGEYDQRSPVFEQIARSVSLPYTSLPRSQGLQNNPWVLGLGGAVVLIIAIFAFVRIRGGKKVEPPPSKRVVKRKRSKK